MNKSSTLSIICTAIFLIGIIAAFLGHLNPGNMSLGYTLIAISLIYLFSGWYLFKVYYPGGNYFLLFLIGYFYSAIFIAFSFVTLKWPLAKTMITLGPVWAVAQLVLIAVIRKKLLKEGFIQFMIEGGLMLIFIIITLVTYTGE